MVYPAPHGGAEPVLVSVGDITCTASEIVTPVGTYPLAGTRWTVNDLSRTGRSTPTWAIVLAILLFFVCLLGLLFLLVREERTSGVVNVTVQRNGLLYTTTIPAYSPATVVDVHARVNHARMLVTHAENTP